MHDPGDRVKQAKSIDAVDRLTRAGLTALSVQSLNEFYRAMRWKVAQRLSSAEALALVDGYARNCRVLPLTATAALDGMRACDQYSMSFWNSLIWAVAKEAEVPYLLSEDFTDGQSIEGVQFIDPFSEAFDVTSLLD
jgi:predicted nucleic acid-binding protein